MISDRLVDVMFKGWDRVTSWKDEVTRDIHVHLVISDHTLMANRRRAEEWVDRLAQKSMPMAAPKRRPLVGRHRMGGGK